MTPKYQKIEYWVYSNYSDYPQENLDSFIDRHFEDGWFAHQVIPTNGSTLSAAYIIFYKF